MEDTIVAIATALGEGGIGIVRMSGDRAISIGDRLFMSPRGRQLEDLKSFAAAYGYCIDPNNNQKMDEVIALVMRGPHTYTKEDVVEFSCHGGTVVLKSIVEAILRQGARLAEPGEFTKRAFLNGRIDLSQAEAVIDLIRAKTERGMEVALHQLEGRLSDSVRDTRDQIMELLAHLEALIDFPEHDLEEIAVSEVQKKCREIAGQLDTLIDSSDRGKIYREGISTIIIGKPNVGKSSLLNALLRENRAIVTDIPGTTRDIIEEIVNIKGIPLKLTDTAGIRHADNLVEQMGVTRTKEYIERGDLIFFVVDGEVGITAEDEEIIPLIQDKQTIVLINKSDLDIDRINYDYLAHQLPRSPLLKISVQAGTGLDQLEGEIVKLVEQGVHSKDNEILVSNLRHRQSLVEARESIGAVLVSIDNEMPLDFLTIDLKSSWEYLGQITGDSISEDIVDMIFSQFCIGK